MIKSIESLPPEKQKVLYDAIPYITLLVAGADGIIEDAELERGEKIAHIRTFHFHAEWQEYYKKVDERLHERLLELIRALPRTAPERQEAISKELSKLNDILPLLDPKHAKHFYDGLLSFARYVAKASGGIIGWMSIGPKEAKVVDLPMIEPVD
ncbi:MAG: hypothetical protein H6557_03825 [Lewinellaceae bacterium]|nr:hypothetical protein [Phaeodactylibacter sp.]MCB9035727.1 hypothetical protein [Lewinellaceae bacterium]